MHWQSQTLLLLQRLNIFQALSLSLSLSLSRCVSLSIWQHNTNEQITCHVRGSASAHLHIKLVMGISYALLDLCQCCLHFLYKARIFVMSDR